ncbi:alpha/beta hydrolase [Lacibacter luteus]|uniref:Alpha/beta hydrolase n=1 Tax=Lacibacter luteus TaxID=2508719 RepID=A0A4Q1CJ57_9BACT|nr:alpha/beta hydrolase [Lacibacter luteus]RXK60681.1 alpha/beta hydrolase [Lacibacter luteus]
MKLKIYKLSFLLLAACTSLYAQQKPIPIDSSYSVANVYKQIHKEFPHAVPAKDSVPANVTAYRNLVYTTLPQTAFGKRELHLDVFTPTAKGMYPALIMIHGGGWRSGTRSMQVPMAQMLAAKGFVTIPVEYQLSLEAKYPAAVYNIKSAIRWVKANAAKYNIDTNRIAISGCSAGGQLASLVGMTNNVLQFEGDHGNTGTGSTVKAIVDIDGVLDFLAPASLNLERKPNSPDIEWLGGSFAEKPLIWKEASAIYWAKPTTALPILFLNSGYSRFHAGQDELIGMMNEWGLYTQVHKFNVMVHPFWLFHPWVDETVDVTAAFLHKVLK